MIALMTKVFSFLRAAIAHAAEALIAKVSSSSFAAAQRRRALAGLDTRQLADIGLIYVDGDYLPHPHAKQWQPTALRPTYNGEPAGNLPGIAVSP